MKDLASPVTLSSVEIANLPVVVCCAETQTEITAPQSIDDVQTLGNTMHVIWNYYYSFFGFTVNDRANHILFEQSIRTSLLIKTCSVVHYLLSCQAIFVKYVKRFLSFQIS